MAGSVKLHDQPDTARAVAVEEEAVNSPGHVSRSQAELRPEDESHFALPVEETRKAERSQELIVAVDRNQSSESPQERTVEAEFGFDGKLCQGAALQGGVCVKEGA